MHNRPSSVSIGLLVFLASTQSSCCSTETELTKRHAQIEYSDAPSFTPVYLSATATKPKESKPRPAVLQLSDEGQAELVKQFADACNPLVKRQLGQFGAVKHAAAPNCQQGISANLAGIVHGIVDAAGLRLRRGAREYTGQAHIACTLSPLELSGDLFNDARFFKARVADQ